MNCVACVICTSQAHSKNAGRSNCGVVSTSIIATIIADRLRGLDVVVVVVVVVVDNVARTSLQQHEDTDRTSAQLVSE